MLLLLMVSLDLGIDERSQFPAFWLREVWHLIHFQCALAMMVLGESASETRAAQTRRKHLLTSIHNIPHMSISISRITVGNNPMDLEFSTIFDTGTSFTYLADPAYTYISQSFHAQVQVNRHVPDSRIPFEYCYDISSSEARILTPDISLRTVSGSLFPVVDAGQVISIQEHEYVYCLAIFKSMKLNIIGPGTSSSGFLVEDVLYLSTEEAHPQILKAPIMLGCGETQTGSFLDAAAPNGLFGLGIDEISVPSILAQRGMASNSFSMCFGHDGIGRISFGDQGSSDQEETPLDINPQHPTYVISISRITVGNNPMDLEFSTIFDTGTSFTYLADPAYTYISQSNSHVTVACPPFLSFHAQVQVNRHVPDSRIPFEYCYDISSSEARILTPDISLRTVSGSLFPVVDAGQVISIQEHEYVYCLAIFKSMKLNIIGRKFQSSFSAQPY
ncbi:hypothetical protein PR202_gb25750 [Eleusine coracana subsp. coracana]|uniref:Peptidase A1 domain-containing protein n=1 Tax=Eleusine coracana subsp. coracana TaxID=191504 RepID=A0AAV5FPE5_ELECO|nr:hypothetical protein PR202_gb25750 [Eleusine coracana subsp. coracana]